MVEPTVPRSARVLVTGGSGFLGSAVTKLLVGAGAEVHVAVRDPSSWRLSGADVEAHVADLTDRVSLDRMAKAIAPTHVVHLAAFTHVGRSWDHVDECVALNISGTVSLLEALDGRYERFVNVGTADVYGSAPVPYRETGPVEPQSPYAVSKYAAERYCRLFHQAFEHRIVMVRPSTGYGPGQPPDRIIPEAIARGLSGRPLEMTTGRQTREFTYVDDLAAGIVAAAVVPGVDGELFNLGSGAEVSIREVVELIDTLLEGSVRPQVGMKPDRPNEIWRMVSDSSLARVRLGWQPTVALDDGLRRTVAWYREAAEAGRWPFDTGALRA